MPAALVLLQAPSLASVARSMVARHDKKGEWLGGSGGMPQQHARRCRLRFAVRLACFASPASPLAAVAPSAGKGKMGAEAADVVEERPCLEVLLGLPARPIGRRSESHLNQGLEVRRGQGAAWCRSACAVLCCTTPAQPLHTRVMPLHPSVPRHVVPAAAVLTAAAV